MPKASISPRTALFLEHMPAVREILKAFERRGEIQADMISLLQQVRDAMSSSVIDSRIDRSGLELHLTIDKNWRVRGKEAITVIVSASQTVEPMSYDESDDPWVGLYVPQEWASRAPFIERLKKCRPAGFEHVNGNPELDDTVPIWLTIHFQKYFRGHVFDEKGYVAALTTAVKSLLLNKSKIDAALTLSKGAAKDSA
ncbi:MAG: hypothetical protein WB992_24785 [Bryobacteraceae bacterium]